MSIMDMFRTQPAQPTQAAPTPGNLPSNAAEVTASTSSPGTAPNGTVPATANTTDASKSPLDAFSDLWQTDPAKANTSGQPLFNVDLNALQKAAQSVDFRTVVKPEHLAAIGQGGDAAVEAFGHAMNAVAQEVYGKSAMASMKLIEGAINKSNSNLKGEIPGMIKQHNVSDTLRTENPALAHPASQPIIDALQSTLATKYPNSTAKELREMATNYLTSFASVISPKPSTDANTGAKGGNSEDWSTFLQ